MLTHHNLVENVRVCLIQIPIIEKTDTFLSFLPLSHVFERTATYHVCLYAGSKIAFAQSLELLAKNMTEVKPHVMNCVPRLLERIHDRAMKNGTSAGGLKSKIFLIAGFIFTTWFAARIYRTGILMYGKKPRLKEMVRWAFRRN